MSTRYVIEDTVRSVKLHTARRWLSGVGSDTVFQEDSTGWYVTLDGNVSFYIGEEEPRILAGDKVRVTVERI